VVTRSDLKANVTLFKEELTSVFVSKAGALKGLKENLMLFANKLLKLCNRFKVQK
tara:strand:- start:649 stop:813 length:165 start_codon:yes stop_codon:yes gene_type:complete